MEDNAIRSMWLDDLWKRIRADFGLTPLPEHALVTCGFPSRGARGDSPGRRPAEILREEWKRNDGYERKNVRPS